MGFRQRGQWMIGGSWADWLEVFVFSGVRQRRTLQGRKGADLGDPSWLENYGGLGFGIYFITPSRICGIKARRHQGCCSVFVLELSEVGFGTAILSRGGAVARRLGI